MSEERESTPPAETGDDAPAKDASSATAEGAAAPKDGKTASKRETDVDKTLPDGSRELESAVAAAAAEVARRKEAAAKASMAGEKKDAEPATPPAPEEAKTDAPSEQPKTEEAEAAE